MINKYLFAVLFIVLPYLVPAQQQRLGNMDDFIAKQVVDYQMPGLAIGIIHNHKVLFKKGYGTTSLPNGSPVDTQTVFPISSCTKAFTAMALAILVEENKLNWDDKVIQYLPDFKLSDPWITKELTIVDLLSHRSGLATFDGDLLWYGTSYTRKEIAEKIRHAPIRNDFRTEMGYQNVMYLVAGLVVEAISGKTWESFVNEKIFVPLSMRNSHTDREWLNPGSNFAFPHIRNKPIPPMDMTNIAPAGGIDASVDDLLTWMEMWLSEGSVDGKRFIDDGALQAMTSLKVMTSESGDNGYGLGWYIGYEDGQKVIHHNGGMPGYRSSIVLFPETGSGIVILTNKLSPINDQLINAIKNYLHEPTAMNWLAADSAMSSKGTVYKWDREPKDNSKLNSSITDFDDYIGTYEDKVYGRAVIRKENGKPFLELLPAKEPFSGYLYASSRDTLIVIFNDPFVPPGAVIFERGTDKKVKSFKLNIDSQDFLFGDLDFRSVFSPL